MEGDEDPKRQWGIKEIAGEVEKGIENSKEKIKERIDEDDVLESKLTWDWSLSLLPIKRLESYLLFRKEPQE